MTNEEIAAKLAEHENRIRVSEYRTKDLEDGQKEIRDLTLSVHKMAVCLENMVTEQREHSNRLNTLEKKPAKKWEACIEKIVTTIIGTFAGALAAGILAIVTLGL